jgi:hypothetical protein
MNSGQVAIAVVVLILLIVLVYWYLCSNSEHMGDPFYLDMMAMKNPDPMYFKYLGWERDITGMSGRDYYLENQRNAGNLAGPYYFEGDAGFVDHTDYLNMPEEYRPVVHTSMTQPVMKSETNSAKEEVKASEHLVNTGCY